MSLFRVPVEDGRVRLDNELLTVPNVDLSRHSEVVLGVRPEDMALGTDGTGLPMVVDVVEELGADAYLYGNPEGVQTFQPLIVRVQGRRPPAKGEQVYIQPSPDFVHLFDVSTGLRLNGDVPEGTPEAKLSDVEAWLTPRSSTRRLWCGRMIRV